MFDDYEINIGTLAVLPVDSCKCLVIESNVEKYVSGTPKSVIENSCEYFGSSYEGRNKGSLSLLGGTTHKAPIIIEESNNIIFFPTISPSREECIWLSFSNILNFKEYAENDTIIEFKNGKKIQIPISVLSLSNQYLRSSKLNAVISARKMQK